VIDHGTADLLAITEQHRPELGYQLLAGIGPAITALTLPEELSKLPGVRQVSSARKTMRSVHRFAARWVSVDKLVVMGTALSSFYR
jgi:hypothetical protein